MPRNIDSIKPPETDVKKIAAEVLKDLPKIKEEVRVEKKVQNSKIFKKILIISVVFLSFLVILVGGIAAGAYAHNSIYKNKVFPGVVVWGEDVGGKSYDEVATQLSKKIQDTRVKLKGPDQEYEATISELGIYVDGATMSLSAYSKGRTSSKSDNYLTRARLLVSSWGWQPLGKLVRGKDLDIEPSYIINDQVLDAYLNKVSENINIQPKDSQISVNQGSINIVPAIFGREVEKKALKDELLGKVLEFESFQLDIKTKEIRPNIVDKAAEDVKVQTESVISRPVTLTFEGQTFKPNKETVASWISYTKKDGSTTYDLVVDPAKMKNYFSFLGTKINIYPVNKKVRVENGVKETVIEEGKIGRLIDEKILGQKISQTLPVQASVDLVIPIYVATFKTQYENVLVADWEKYIDINLSTQTMTANLKGGTVVGSWKVTTGKSSTPTPVGTWLVHGKTAVTRMTGGTPGIDYYDLPNVHWVTWFKGGGYAIHEAYWRTSFGGGDYVWNGSHGCVNSPIDVAKFIYDWAPVGTPVIVHY